MSEEALLGCVVPAVALPGHGLDKLVVFQLLDESVAGVMAALVRVDDGGVVQGAAVLLNQRIHRLYHEIHFQRLTQPVGQNLSGHGIQDGGKVAFSGFVEQVGDVRQEDLPGFTLEEVSLENIRSDVICLHGPCHPFVGILSPNWAFQTIFPH